MVMVHSVTNVRGSIVILHVIISLSLCLRVSRVQATSDKRQMISSKHSIALEVVFMLCGVCSCCRRMVARGGNVPAGGRGYMRGPGGDRPSVSLTLTRRGIRMQICSATFGLPLPCHAFTNLNLLLISYHSIPTC
jgi:hypothetical protein